MPITGFYQSFKAQLDKVIFGQDEAVDLALAAFFSAGHVLLEGMPGTAKTMLVRAMAAAINMSCNRVQMTPDLMPGDVTGSSIYREDLHDFEFKQGPIFTNFLLADEINRAPAKTQSALLEAMQELHVTHSGSTWPLPCPFIVFATQNPVEQEGTYPLPLAQLDRFMFRIQMGYPEPKEEERILREHHATGGAPDMAALGIEASFGFSELAQAREIVRQTFIRDEIVGYMRRIVQATREHDSLAVGASPRAALMLLAGAKAFARFAGRDFVTPDDIKAVGIPSLCHRLILSPTAELEGVMTEDVVTDIFESIEVPR